MVIHGNAQSRVKAIPMKLYDVSTIGLVSLGSNPGVPFFVNVSHMIPMVLVESYRMFKITCGEMLFGFGKEIVEAVRPSLVITLRVSPMSYNSCIKELG